MVIAGNSYHLSITYNNIVTDQAILRVLSSRTKGMVHTVPLDAVACTTDLSHDFTMVIHYRAYVKIFI